MQHSLIINFLNISQTDERCKCFIQENSALNDINLWPLVLINGRLTIIFKGMNAFGCINLLHENLLQLLLNKNHLTNVIIVILIR